MLFLAAAIGMSPLHAAADEPSPDEPAPEDRSPDGTPDDIAPDGPEPAPLADAPSIRRGHATFAVGLGVGAVSLAAVTAQNGPKLDSQDVLAVHAVGDLVGVTGAALAVGGIATARHGVHERGVALGRGGTIAGLVGLGIGTGGAFCLIASQHEVVDGNLHSFTAPPAPCAAAYVLGLSTSYLTAIGEGVVHAAVTPTPPDEPDEPDKPDEAEPADPEDPVLELQLAPLLLPHGASLTVSGRF